MWGKNSKFSRKLPCLDSDCLPHHDQIANETRNEGKIAEKTGISCDVCTKESNINFEETTKDLESLVDEKAPNEQPKETNSSFLHAVINMIGTLIGLGQLSTPYALENGGWTSAFLLVGLAVVTAYSSHLLGKCMGKNPNSRDYKDIGQKAFGAKGRIIVATLIYVEIFMTLVSYTISLHDNLATVFLGTHFNLSWTNLTTSQILTVLAILVALPSLWLRDLSSISFLSTGGILMSLVIFVTVACTAIFGGVKANHSIPALKIQNIPAISGLYIFSYGGHIVFPNIYAAMKDPSKFTKEGISFLGVLTKVSIMSFTFVTLLYTALAFMGAKLFGPEVNSQITLSMPRDLIVTKIALWATVLTPITKYALEFAPFAIQLEQNILPHTMRSRTKSIIRGSVGSILLIMIVVLALSVPYFEHVLSLTGSLVSVGICVIFPCAFYVKIFWNQISRPVLILNMILIVIGTLLGAFGTISSFRLLLKNLRRAHSA